MKMNSHLPIENFYQKLASHYDAMTRLEQRWNSEREILQKWLQKFPFRRGLDAACGTGLHALLLSQLGVEMWGADISKEMLKQARKNARTAGVSVKWIQAPLEKLTKNIHHQFQAVLCLGNSIPHLLTKSQLLSTFQNFYHLLEPGGRVILQLLNYHKILSDKQRIIGIHRKDNLEFIRFYDYKGKLINFNILTIIWEKQKAISELQSTLLYPYTLDELQNYLQKVNLFPIAVYGDMHFSKFARKTSPNLVMVAQKNRH